MTVSDANKEQSIPAVPWTLTARHLIVCQHGLLGSEKDFSQFVALFQMHLSTHNLYIHSAESNAVSIFTTYDGIDQGGNRLANEIQRIAKQMPNLKNFSFIGHSMGGLYGRYCMGVLFSRGFFDHVEACSFIALAVPHFGVRRPKRGSWNAVVNSMVPLLFHKSGQQLYLNDIASKEAEEMSESDATRSDIVQELESVRGELLACSSIPLDSEECAFQNVVCSIENRIFSLENPVNIKFELIQCRVTLMVPRSKTDQDPFDIYIEPNEENQPSVIVRIPRDRFKSQWNWITAISQHAFGLSCEEFNPAMTSNLHRKLVSEKQDAKPLLCCLTRGRFVQALSLFKRRHVYANVFYDLQVPFSCASIRAYNPYRLRSENDIATSTTYPHLTQESVNQASLKSVLNTFQPQRPQAITRLWSPFNLSPNRARLGLECDRTREESVTVGHRGTFAMVRDRVMGRSDPLIDRTNRYVVLDHVHEAFGTDSQRDLLRGMLISLQSLGWVRLDVLFHSILAHEKIIAKRADPSKTDTSGIDVIHHIIDTFLV
uniref:Uncharacterized protein AlNc14C188G8391 n=1 Tax=Albugo laibachii Nc14 TaxID=890382 RepID=F0WFK4_9STRA|nr:conserved hypothetical protein [Albugo laibachii Nc14]CCA23300.1 conserved hypothetical protein [Albugo laibachii Nc14]|eukprot:CCA23300.1 conserved hypothetical protein [Albugo laibachii Nc14]